MALAAGLVTTSVDVQAQGMMDRLKKRAADAAKRKAEDRTEKKAGEATDKALDKAECIAAGNCPEPVPAADPAASTASGASAVAVAPATSAAGASVKPGEGAWRNYDFVPGERVIFTEDFMRDTVGDFPKRFTFKRGNIETVEWQGGRYLSTNTFASRFSIKLPEVLPERFTLELDYSATDGNGAQIYFVDPDKGSNNTHVEFGTNSGGVRGGGIDAIGAPSGNQYRYKDVVFPVRIMADGAHVKVYMGDTRVANVPNANLGRSNTIYFELPGREERAAMIGNVRVAAGGRKLYDALAEKGRVATQGILFATGSDQISPESTPTLKEIGAMLAEHPELKLAIEGHTDNVGAAAANQTLSEKRSAAVREFLVREYKVDAGRLTSAGLGASKPVVPNDTPEGRHQNRRVELVKM